MNFPKENLVKSFIEKIDTMDKRKHILRKVKGKYRPISSKEFRKDVINLSLGLKQIGIRNGDKVSIISETSYEWLVSDLAILSLGAITVPIYPSLSADQVSYILNDSKSKAVIFSTKAQWEKLKTVKGDIKTVEHYFSYLKESPKEEILTLKELKEVGAELTEEDYYEMIKKIDSDDIATIIYTSGTTGVPKGVILTHSNIFSNVFTALELIDISAEDTTFSFLPLSHVYERMVTHAYVRCGATIAYAESIAKVANNIPEVKPTIMVSVPRLFERVYSKVVDTALLGPKPQRKIFLWALETGKRRLDYELKNKKIPAALKVKNKLAEKLVFSKIKNRLGGNFRFFLSGGAALSKEVGEFFYKIGIPVLQGYGLTETSPVISVNTFEDSKIGSVGKPIPGVKVKIGEDGEILVKGPNVMQGYFKKDKETEKAFTKDGWFKTGDIGFLDEEDFLFITDRKKSIIVTGGGKNVAPQPIENRIKQSPYIINVMLVGNERKYLSALIVPDFEKMNEVSSKIRKSFKNKKEFLKNKAVTKFFLKEVKKMVPDLADFEKIKRVGLLKDDFSIEKGELTPTQKVRRAFVEKKYKKLIDSLY